MFFTKETHISAATHPRTLNLVEGVLLVALLLLSYGCAVAEVALWLLLGMPWVGLHCVVVFFPDRAHCFLGIKLIQRHSILLTNRTCKGPLTVVMGITGYRCLLF